jgi:PleD family two-component response regulator
VPLEGLNLLVVDDDREACAMLQIILGEQGAIVVLAYDYAGALRVLDTLSPTSSSATSACPARTATSWSARSGGARR